MGVRSLAGAGLFRGVKLAGVVVAGLVVGVILVLVLAGGRSADAQVGNESSQNPRDLDKGCTTHRVPVTIPDPEDLAPPEGDTAEAEVYGELCLPLFKNGKPYAPKTVQLLVHGITYGTSYFDFPDDPDTPADESERNSYVDYTTNAGYATFNIDRLGEGRSDHPPSALVTLDTAAMVASQLLEKLRNGDIGGKGFRYTILTGHSYGSATSWLAQAEHDDGNPLYPGGADALVSTGWGHRLQSDPVQRFFGEQIPAESDPKFQNDGEVYDAGYFTPSPPPYPLDPYAGNEREKDYLYYLGENIYKPSTLTGYKEDNDPSDDGVSQNVLRLDSELKQTVTQEELQTFQNRDFDGTTRNIRVPVFLINGTEELFFCGDDLPTSKNGNPSLPSTEPGYYCGSNQALTNFEGQFFRGDACFTGFVIPDNGHDSALHRNVKEPRGLYPTAERLADLAIGPNGGNAERYAAKCNNKRSP